MRLCRLNSLDRQNTAIWRVHTLLCIMICIIGGLAFIYDVLGIQSYTVSSLYRAEPLGSGLVYIEEIDNVLVAKEEIALSAKDLTQPIHKVMFIKEEIAVSLNYPAQPTEKVMVITHKPTDKMLVTKEKYTASPKHLAQPTVMVQVNKEEITVSPKYLAQPTDKMMFAKEEITVRPKHLAQSTIYSTTFTKNVKQDPKYLEQPLARAVIFTEEKRQPGFLLRTPGCSTPDMDAMDTSIKTYIFEEEEVICNGGLPALVDSNLTSLYLLKSSLVRYKINDTNLLSCCYQPFHRVDPEDTYRDMEVKFDELCHDFKESVDVNQEFVRVACKYNKTDIYKDFVNFVPLKNTRMVRDVPRDDLNVLLIGLDSISRLNFIRQMPKTIGILEELGAVEMLGFNKVGDNTFPNLVPLLTGMTTDELQANCWPNRTSHFDACPFVWKQFEEAGYATAFAEDAAWMGLFHYTMNGFKHQPTDYFYDHWDYTATNEIGNMHRLNVHQCIGAKATYKALLDYTEKFTRSMLEYSRPYFGFFWQSTLSHDFLNTPKLGDQDYHDLLSNLNRTGVLNNTVLIFMSDHGIRWGGIRSTYQGRMEERMPFLYVQLPNWFKQRNSVLYNNLRTNRNRLITHFDIHETIKDLINSHYLTDKFITERDSHQVFQRGYSLFSNITVKRSCDDAGIATHWCTCQTSKSVAVNDAEVVEAANYTIHEHLNKILAGNVECATLQLDRITGATIQVNTDTLPKLDSQFYQDYTVTFITKPGGGTFETTLRKVNDMERYHFNVTGTVSRINTYGNQSDCITNSRLKLYCYCRHYLTD